MPKFTTHTILDEAINVLRENRGEMRFAKLVEAVTARLPECKPNTVFAQISILNEKRPKEVTRPSRGLYQLTSNAVDEGYISDTKKSPTKTSSNLREEDFYQSFADFLKSELGEATEAEPIGGAVLRTKWGTPDVLGVYKKPAGSFVDFPREFIAGEVKIDPQESIVAFGQAMAYRLFTHKSYIAMPAKMNEADKDRLDALCMLFGLGLVFFELDPQNPNYTIRVRAQRFAPDWFYVNELGERLKESDHKAFGKLFG